MVGIGQSVALLWLLIRRAVVGGAVGVLKCRGVVSGVYCCFLPVGGFLLAVLSFLDWKGYISK